MMPESRRDSGSSKVVTTRDGQQLRLYLSLVLLVPGCADSAAPSAPADDGTLGVINGLR